jgi:hypothetical protein
MIPFIDGSLEAAAYSAASQRWLPEDVFENEKLPEVAGARCAEVSREPARLEFDCKGAADLSRKLVLVKEPSGAWRVAETARALRLLAKAVEEIDAYSAALHGAEIDPGERAFDIPIVRHVMTRQHRAKVAAEHLARESPRADKVLARADMTSQDRASILLGRAWLEYSAARGAPQGEDLALLDKSAADAAEAGKLNPALAHELEIFAGYRERFRRGASDAEWFAWELKNRRELLEQAGTDAIAQHKLFVRVRDLSKGVLGEECGEVSDWRGVFAGSEAGRVEVKLPAGDDFAIVFATDPERQADAPIVESARALKPGACVIFSARMDPCVKGAEAEAVRAPRFYADFLELMPCSDAPQPAQKNAQADQRR